MRGVEHRLWLKEPLTISTYVAELPLEDDFEMRAQPVMACAQWQAARSAIPHFVVPAAPTSLALLQNERLLGSLKILGFHRLPRPSRSG